MKPLGDKDSPGGDRPCAHGNGHEYAKNEKEIEEIKCEGQEHYHESYGQDTHEDELPTAHFIVDIAQKGLADAVDQDAQRPGKGDEAATPTELFAHWEDKDAYAVPGTHGDHDDKKGGCDNEPAVVDLG